MDSAFNRVSRRRRRGQGGFTLIELLVVIAVLAILAGIVIFNVTGVANKGQTNACLTDTKSVQTAVDAYQNDNNAYPLKKGDTMNKGVDVDVSKLVPTYLHTTPSTKDGTFTFLDTNGTVTASACP
ncbi:MAG: type II secretion system protein [Candidatus Dormibacteria bacterium]